MGYVCDAAVEAGRQGEGRESAGQKIYIKKRRVWKKKKNLPALAIK